MNDRLYIRASNNMFEESIQLRLRLRTTPGEGLPYTSIPETVKFRRISKDEELSCIPEPNLIIETYAAQELMNDLWNCGIRPSQAKGTAGQLEAVNKHLEDMRTLVFKGVGK